MLQVHHLNFSFVDNGTGEVIRQYRYQQGENKENNFDIQAFVSDKILSSFMASFKRGVLKKRNISLQIDYFIENVF